MGGVGHMARAPHSATSSSAGRTRLHRRGPCLLSPALPAHAGRREPSLTRTLRAPLAWPLAHKRKIRAWGSSMKILALCLPFGAALLAATAQAAFAADLKVLTAGAMRAVVVALVSEFEPQTGHRVTIANATPGRLTQRLTHSDPF